MKHPISVHVDSGTYDELKRLAADRGRPVAELIREAMSLYVDQERRSGPSLAELPARSLGRMRRGWTRAEVWEEMTNGRAE